ncbi:hypothetical protein [Clostridium sp. YIM B02555]
MLLFQTGLFLLALLTFIALLIEKNLKKKQQPRIVIGSYYFYNLKI